MTNSHSHQKEKRRVFEYVLEDFLEVKASLDTKKVKPIKKFLFSQEHDGWLLSPIEGFCLNGQLILFRQGTSSLSFRNLVFINPKDGEICVIPLQG